MTAIALNGRGFGTVATDGGDAWSGWTSIATAAGLGGACLGWLVSTFWRGLTQASSVGRAGGVVDAQIAALSIRMTALEGDKDRLRDRLDNAATKQDLKDVAADIKVQLGEMRAEVRENRGYRPSSTA